MGITVRVHTIVSATDHYVICCFIDSDGDSNTDRGGTTSAEMDEGGVSNISGCREPGDGGHTSSTLSDEPPSQDP